MSLAGPVTPLATLPLRSAFLIEIGPPVGAVIETLRLGVVAGSASVGTNVERSISRPVRGLRWWRLFHLLLAGATRADCQTEANQHRRAQNEGSESGRSG